MRGFDNNKDDDLQDEFEEEEEYKPKPKPKVMKEDIKKEIKQNIQLIEREINLTYLNEKLNYIIQLLEKENKNVRED